MFFTYRENLIVLLVSEPWGIWVKESKPSLPELSPIVSVTPIYVIETSKKKKAGNHSATTKEDVFWNNNKEFIWYKENKPRYSNLEIQTKLLRIF